MLRRHFFAIGALAGITIFCETALTRLFSVVQYYHGAFLAISVALFGFAVSGVFVLLREEKLGRERLDATLARYALLFSVAIPVSFYTYLYVGLEPRLRELGLPALLATACEYALLAVPFFASGVCISLLLFHGARDANRLYATDLVCSALGAVAVIPALTLLGGPKSMLAASAAAALVALPFAHAARGAKTLAPALALGALAALAFLPARQFEQLRLRKPALIVASEQIRWNAFSMVGVGPEETRPYRQRQIVIDNSVGTAMTAFDGDFAKLSFLRSEFAATAYLMVQQPRVLIIGSGGGRDILMALLNGASHVRAVEVNPLVFETSARIFGDFTGHLYSHPLVQPVVGDARSYIANSHEQFDVVLASLIDTWAASSAGAFALTENLLYTTDAFRDYYEHLTPDGVLSISRWHPFETPRLLATAFSAWKEAGASDPRQHVILVIQAGRYSTLLLKKSPFTGDEIARVEAYCNDSGQVLALTPRYVGDPIVRDYLEGKARPETWAGVDLSPASDERPFFFNMVKPSTQLLRMLGFGEPGRFEREAFEGNLSATRALIHLLGAVIVLLLFTVIAPLALRGSAVRQPGWLAMLGYFACLGLGFIVVEVGLLQRLILLLGQPIYALAVILSTMLLASGCGSFVAGRLGPERLRGRLSLILGAAAALITGYAFFLPALLDALLGSPFPLRLLAAVVLVALPGFALGMPFPSGIRALELGYTAVFLLGAACYGLASLLLRLWPAAAAARS